MDNSQPYIPDPLTRRKKIDCKPELIITALQRFYQTFPDISKVMPYFQGKSTLSLRIIDWFVTKFCRKNFTHYTLAGKDFIVYRSYKGQLKAYSKQYFDPNCRRERIMFKIQNYEPITTTIGQLNFFRWAMETNVLEYIEANEEQIRTGYNSYLKETTTAHKRDKLASASSTASVATASTLSTVSSTTSPSTVTVSAPHQTRRRRSKQTPSSLRQLQISANPIQLDFS